MIYKYSGFIPQNIAPKGATNIAVYNGDKKISSIPLGRLSRPTRERLYSVGIISDVHCYSSAVDWSPDTKLDNALSYFETEGCLFVCNSGDMTQSGFYNEGDAETLVTAQFDTYKKVCDKHTIPVYELCGNHESYVKNITNNLTEYKSYTGADLHYSVVQGNDLFIFLSQPAGNKPMTDEALQWLYETLEANRNKRCFIFVHPYISGDSGNALTAYGNPVFDWWEQKTTAFKSLLSHYKNTILFHGHSHMMWECQELDETANYTEKNGFKSVHIPSLTRPCSIIDGVRTYQDSKSYGYLMDVYNDCVVLNGFDFINDEAVPIGTLKIDTTLVKIEPNTFTDSTGIIVIN